KPNDSGYGAEDGAQWAGNENTEQRPLVSVRGQNNRTNKSGNKAEKPNRSRTEQGTNPHRLPAFTASLIVSCHSLNQEHKSRTQLLPRRFSRLARHLIHYEHPPSREATARQAITN